MAELGRFVAGPLFGGCGNLTGQFDQGLPNRALRRVDRTKCLEIVLRFQPVEVCVPSSGQGVFLPPGQGPDPVRERLQTTGLPQFVADFAPLAVDENSRGRLAALGLLILPAEGQAAAVGPFARRAPNDPLLEVDVRQPDARFFFFGRRRDSPREGCQPENRSCQAGK